MEHTITGRKLEVTDALKNHIAGALDKIEAHFDKIISADVVLSVDKLRHIAEINLVANGLRIHGREDSDDMYTSVDNVMSKISRQVLKHKGRINRHTPRSAKELRHYEHAILAAGALLETSAEDSGSTETSAHREVSREQVPMKPMMVDEATLQLDLTDDLFLVFSNANTSQVNVIYRHSDGTFGLIEPQY